MERDESGQRYYVSEPYSLGVDALAQLMVLHMDGWEVHLRGGPSRHDSSTFVVRVWKKGDGVRPEPADPEWAEAEETARRWREAQEAGS